MNLFILYAYIVGKTRQQSERKKIQCLTVLIPYFFAKIFIPFLISEFCIQNMPYFIMYVLRIGYDNHLSNIKDDIVECTIRIIARSQDI